MATITSTSSRDPGTFFGRVDTSLASRRWWAITLGRWARIAQDRGQDPWPEGLARFVDLDRTRWPYGESLGARLPRDQPGRCFLAASVRQPWAPEAQPYLDPLTRSLSAFPSFRDLLWRGPAHGYRPSLYPTGGYTDLLAWAYDNAMAEAGHPWRAFPDYGAGPSRPYGGRDRTYVIRTPGAWSTPVHVEARNTTTTEE